MKIGVVTVHDSANFGSFLQAFGLKETLEKMGHDVYFIKTRSRKKVYKLFLGNSKNIKKYFYNKKKYKIFMKEIEEFKEIELLKLKENPKLVDLLIIGSDELWNVDTPVFRNEFFYGISINTKRKIAYAISSGSATYEKLMEYPNLVKGIKEIDKIFVRDKLTGDNVRRITGINPEFTCDPTFLVDVSEFKKKYSNPIKDKYLLIYSYTYSKKQKEYIVRYARENDLKIVSTGLYSSWCDKNINCSPLEFSEVICGAEAVVTSTFHGTIFSILNKKQFVTFSGRQKVKDVLEKTNLSDAIFNENDSYENFKLQFDKKLDFNEAHNRILSMREESIEKLRKELCKEEN
ncbi:MAG: polysaccharide pyruvyl transferase family protein [Clostridiales bacterium]|nr:polysaccharide pyruvyl transferase family protein [Clostridiales bacterium]